MGDWGTPFGMLIERLEDLDSDGIDPEEALSDLGEFYGSAELSSMKTKTSVKGPGRGLSHCRPGMGQPFRDGASWLTYQWAISKRSTSCSAYS